MSDIKEEVVSTRLMIKGGRIVNDDGTFLSDVYIEDGIIKKIGSDLDDTGCKVVDATDKLVMPGGIDNQTHFQMPSMGTASVDDFYRGTRAALAGGTTMIVDCAICKPGQSLLESFTRWREWADNNVCCDYSLQIQLSSWSEKVSTEMEQLIKDNGVSLFKVSLAASDSAAFSDSDVYQFFRKCSQLGALSLVHAENGSLIQQKAAEIFSEGITGPEGHLLSRPEELEAEAVNRIIMLANQANAPVYVTSLMSRSSSDILADWRRRGAVAIGETIAAALATTGLHVFNKCWRHSASHVTSPPLRPDLVTSGHLMSLFANGELQVVSSGNCTYNVNQKAIGRDDFRLIPSGVNGVEDRMSIVWQCGVSSGKIDPCQFVAITSTNAAKILNVYPRKGRIAVGSDGDVVVWDPSAVKIISSKRHNQNCDFNVFEGFTCHGTPTCVVCNGHVVFDRDGLHETKGSGRYISTPSHSEYVYGRILERRKIELEKVEREAYSGPGPVTLGNPNSATSSTPANLLAHNNNCTKSPNESGQDSSDHSSNSDRPSKRAGTRVNQPPGGKSTPFW